MESDAAADGRKKNMYRKLPCKFQNRKGGCRFGSKCKFAHSEEGEERRHGSLLNRRDEEATAASIFEFLEEMQELQENLSELIAASQTLEKAERKTSGIMASLSETGETGRRVASDADKSKATPTNLSSSSDSATQKSEHDLQGGIASSVSSINHGSNAAARAVQASRNDKFSVDSWKSMPLSLKKVVALSMDEKAAVGKKKADEGKSAFMDKRPEGINPRLWNSMPSSLQSEILLQLENYEKESKQEDSTGAGKGVHQSGISKDSESLDGEEVIPRRRKESHQEDPAINYLMKVPGKAKERAFVAMDPLREEVAFTTVGGFRGTKVNFFSSIGGTYLYSISLEANGGPVTFLPSDGRLAVVVTDHDEIWLFTREKKKWSQVPEKIPLEKGVANCVERITALDKSNLGMFLLELSPSRAARIGMPKFIALLQDGTRSKVPQVFQHFTAVQGIPGTNQLLCAEEDNILLLDGPGFVPQRLVFPQNERIGNVRPFLTALGTLGFLSQSPKEGMSLYFLSRVHPSKSSVLEFSKAQVHGVPEDVLSIEFIEVGAGNVVFLHASVEIPAHKKKQYGGTMLLHLLYGTCDWDDRKTWKVSSVRADVVKDNSVGVKTSTTREDQSIHDRKNSKRGGAPRQSDDEDKEASAFLLKELGDVCQERYFLANNSGSDDDENDGSDPFVFDGSLDDQHSLHYSDMQDAFSGHRSPSSVVSNEYVASMASVMASPSSQDQQSKRVPPGFRGSLPGRISTQVGEFLPADDRKRSGSALPPFSGPTTTSDYGAYFTQPSPSAASSPGFQHGRDDNGWGSYGGADSSFQAAGPSNFFNFTPRSTDILSSYSQNREIFSRGEGGSQSEEGNPESAGTSSLSPSTPPSPLQNVGSKSPASNSLFTYQAQDSESYTNGTESSEYKDGFVTASFLGSTVADNVSVSNHSRFEPFSSLETGIEALSTDTQKDGVSSDEISMAIFEESVPSSHNLTKGDDSGASFSWSSKLFGSDMTMANRIGEDLSGSSVHFFEQAASSASASPDLVPSDISEHAHNFATLEPGGLGRSWDSGEIVTEKEEEQHCGLCSQSFESINRQIQLKGCGHSFHPICLQEFRSQDKSMQGKCPICGVIANSHSTLSSEPRREACQTLSHGTESSWRAISSSDFNKRNSAPSISNVPGASRPQESQKSTLKASNGFSVLEDDEERDSDNYSSEDEEQDGDSAEESSSPLETPSPKGEISGEVVSLNCSADALAEKERGDSFFSQKNYTEALVAYTAAAKLDPHCSQLLVLCAEACTQSNKIVEAISFLETAVQIDQTNVNVFISLGVACLRAGKVLRSAEAFGIASTLSSKAMKSFSKEKNDADFCASRIKQAKSFSLQKKFKKADQAIQEGLKRLPKCDELLELRNDLHKKEVVLDLDLRKKDIFKSLMSGNGDFGEAEYLGWELVHSTKMKDAEALNLYATALFAKGKIEEAVKYYEMCFELGPMTEESVANLSRLKTIVEHKAKGIRCMEEEKYEEAFDHIREAKKLATFSDPDACHAELCLIQAQIYLGLQCVLAASAEAIEAFQLDPLRLSFFRAKLVEFWEFLREKNETNSVEKENVELEFPLPTRSSFQVDASSSDPNVCSKCFMIWCKGNRCEIFTKEILSNYSKVNQEDPITLADFVQNQHDLKMYALLRMPGAQPRFIENEMRKQLYLTIFFFKMHIPMLSCLEPEEVCEFCNQCHTEPNLDSTCFMSPSSWFPLTNMDNEEEASKHEHKHLSHATRKFLSFF